MEPLPGFCKAIDRFPSLTYCPLADEVVHSVCGMGATVTMASMPSLDTSFSRKLSLRVRAADLVVTAVLYTFHRPSNVLFRGMAFTGENL